MLAKPNVLKRSDILLTIQLLALLRDHGQAPISVEANRLINIFEDMAGKDQW